MINSQDIKLKLNSSPFRGLGGRNLLFFFFVLSIYISAQNSINTIEYWTDGNTSARTQRNLSASNPYNWEELVDAANLADGVHSLNVRFRDDRGIWTNVQTHFFIKQTNAAGETALRKINAVEYWTDDNTSARTQRNLSASNPYNWEELVDAANLADGVHSLNVRFRDDGGVWANVHSYFFTKVNDQVLPIGENRIVGYRLWYAAEPNFIDNYNVSASQSLVNIDDSVSVTYLPRGKWQIAYQVKDKNGVWSPIITDSITKTDNPLFSFLADKREIMKSEKVIFTPAYTQFIDSIVWSFGDGITEVNFNPEHTYTADGQFDVTATVWHKGSTSGIDYVEIKYIIVTPTGIFAPKVNTLKMYPVPVQAELTIESPDAMMKKVCVMSLNGTILQEKTCNDPAKEIISFSRLSKGAYIIVVETDKGVMSEKVTKK